MKNCFSSDIYSKRDKFLVEMRKRDTKEFIDQSRVRQNPEVFQNTPISDVPKDDTKQSEESVKDPNDKTYDYFESIKNEYYKCQETDFTELYSITQKLRKFISNNKDPNSIPLEAFAKSGLMSYINVFLSQNYDSQKQQQQESIWILSNLATADYDKLILNFSDLDSIVEKVTRFLYLPWYWQIFEHVLWFIGNITSSKSSGSTRNKLIMNGVYRKILDDMITLKGNLGEDHNSKKKCSSNFLIKNSTWLFANMFKGDQIFELEIMDGLYKPTIKFLISLLNTNFNIDMQSEVIWSIYSFIINSKQELVGRIEWLFQNNKLEEVLIEGGFNAQKVDSKAKKNYLKPQIGVLGILTYLRQSIYIKRIILSKGCELLVGCIETSDFYLAGDAAWVLGYIFSENNTEILAFKQNKEFIEKLIFLLGTCTNQKVKSELAKIFYYIAKKSFPQKLVDFVLTYHDTLLYAQLEALNFEDPELNISVVDTLEIILQKERICLDSNEKSQILDCLSLLNNKHNLENLQNSKNESLYQIATELIGKYRISFE